MGCCGSGQRQQANKTPKAKVVQMPLQAQQKGIALKISNQVTSQIAAMVRKNPHLIQNRAM
jgi:hypothetical protein